MVKGESKDDRKRGDCDQAKRDLEVETLQPIINISDLGVKYGSFIIFGSLHSFHYYHS